MSGKLSTLAAASLLIAMTVGCQGPNVVRGQSPSGPAQSRSAVLPAGFCCDNGMIYHKEMVMPDAIAPSGGCPGGCGGNCYGGSCGYGGCGCNGMGGDAYGWGGMGCGNGCGGKCGYDGLFPRHYNTYGYKPPEDLRYPQPQQPGAVVQYPFYTVKGPSDFFLK